MEIEGKRKKEHMEKTGNKKTDFNSTTLFTEYMQMTKTHQ